MRSSLSSVGGCGLAGSWEGTALRGYSNFWWHRAGPGHGFGSNGLGSFWNFGALGLWWKCDHLCQDLHSLSGERSVLG